LLCDGDQKGGEEYARGIRFRFVAALKTGASASLAGGYPIADSDFVTVVLGLLGTGHSVLAGIAPFTALLLQTDGRVNSDGTTPNIARFRIHRAASIDHTMTPRSHHAVGLGTFRGGKIYTIRGKSISVTRAAAH